MGACAPTPPIKEKERKTRRKQEFGDSKKIRGIKFETRDLFNYDRSDVYILYIRRI